MFYRIKTAILVRGHAVIFFRKPVYDVETGNFSIIEPRAVIVLTTDLILYLFAVIKILIDPRSYNSFCFTKRIIIMLLDNISCSGAGTLQGCLHVPHMVGQIVVVGIGGVARVTLQVAFFRIVQRHCPCCATLLAVFYPANVVTPCGRSTCGGYLPELCSQ